MDYERFKKKICGDKFGENKYFSRLLYWFINWMNILEDIKIFSLNVLMFLKTLKLRLLKTFKDFNVFCTNLKKEENKNEINLMLEVIKY